MVMVVVVVVVVVVVNGFALAGSIARTLGANLGVSWRPKADPEMTRGFYDFILDRLPSFVNV